MSVTAAALQVYWATDHLAKEHREEEAFCFRPASMHSERETSRLTQSAAVRGLLWVLEFDDAGVAQKVSMAAFERGLIAESAGTRNQGFKLSPSLLMDDRSDGTLVDATLQREAHRSDDRAEELLRLLSDGKPSTVEHWRHVRDLVTDTPLFESDFRDTIGRVLSSGLTSGLFAKTGDGAVVFATGRSDYPQFLPTRPDNFSTQHLRHVALRLRRLRVYVGPFQ